MPRHDCLSDLSLFSSANFPAISRQKTSGTMVYISADGSVDGSRSRSRNPFKLLADLFLGLINGILLFFRTISTPPERLTEVSSCSIRLSGWERKSW